MHLLLSRHPEQNGRDGTAWGNAAPEMRFWQGRCCCERRILWVVSGFTSVWGVSEMLGGDLVAVWEVALSDDVYRIEFAHGTTTGKRVVCVNGQVGGSGLFCTVWLQFALNSSLLPFGLQKHLICQSNVNISQTLSCYRLPSWLSLTCRPPLVSNWASFPVELYQCMPLKTAKTLGNSEYCSIKDHFKRYFVLWWVWDCLDDIWILANRFKELKLK